jgi:hypothetical protein
LAVNGYQQKPRREGKVKASSSQIRPAIIRGLVKVYAKGRDVAIGKTVSELVRRGLHAPLQTTVVNGFHVVDLPSGSPVVTTEDVRKLQDELE